MAEERRFKTYEEFWPYYVAEHRDPTSRRLHFVGTTLVMGIGVAGFAAPILWAAMPVAGYGFAWVGHFFFEKNRPATFTYPAWSLRADFRMWRKIVLGQMDEELARADRLFPRDGAAAVA